MTTAPTHPAAPAAYYLTITQFAARINRSREHVAQLIRRGDVAFHLDQGIPRGEVARFLEAKESRRVAGTPGPLPVKEEVAA